MRGNEIAADPQVRDGTEPTSQSHNSVLQTAGDLGNAHHYASSGALAFYSDLLLR